ncbi:hypothetical protein Mp_1g15770 [Marchantia polymorpha subsp. ruderalis]|uniref:Uncharacterized protein n=2 Tax=Marchantia polymorpha TaxID=3197 RepID=A0AAF6AQL0_MARPO|nr:hypothetical protein MARPO_0033s0084 [Marchantia polymorpha]BBM98730.1 hypothetical protein Mp_1g15770 [Marchantia polymorpha subsp. ruderalis]|eukprot:PTQ41676.1 hypothetical protein MARPO_0033s0084 [Marchantia polymorpha]
MVYPSNTRFEDLIDICGIRSQNIVAKNTEDLLRSILFPIDLKKNIRCPLWTIRGLPLFPLAIASFEELLCQDVESRLCALFRIHPHSDGGVSELSFYEAIIFLLSKLMMCIALIFYDFEESLNVIALYDFKKSFNWHGGHGSSQ